MMYVDESRIPDHAFEQGTGRRFHACLAGRFDELGVDFQDRAVGREGVIGGCPFQIDVDELAVAAGFGEFEALLD